MIVLNFVFILAGIAFCIMHFKFRDETTSSDHVMVGLVMLCTALNGLVVLKYFNLFL